jgi:hypothetical protein
LPPPNQCRVWYDNRPVGRQPAPTSCARAEVVAARDRQARVVYGEEIFWRRGDNGRSARIDDGRDHDRASAFRNGYRDGMTKGREDAEDGDRYDVNRHSWYRSATRGYEYALGTRYEYIDRYRRGFEAGYAEGYRVYSRRR